MFSFTSRSHHLLCIVKHKSDHFACVLFLCEQAALGGIIRGAGKQRVGAVCNMVGYYGVGFPIGLPLMFAAKLGIKGKIYCRDVF